MPFWYRERILDAQVDRQGDLPQITGMHATFIAYLMTAFPPTLALDALVAGISIATGVIAETPVTADPPAATLDSLVPGISVVATSP